jgi:tRNA dimethylallyltransferase
MKESAENSSRLISIMGPTACGKTRLAVMLAGACGGEILSADSRQVFRKMDIGTGKDLDEYFINGQQIPLHLTDIAEPGTEFSLFTWVTACNKAFREICNRGNPAILCGGTGLYLEAVLRSYSLHEAPENKAFRGTAASLSDYELETMLRELKPLHNITDTENRERLLRAIEVEMARQQQSAIKAAEPDRTFNFILMLPREEVRNRITKRLQQRLRSGMIEEVESLLASGVDPEMLVRYGLEYRYITWYLQGKLNKDEMEGKLRIAIHQFSKRQMTWFRGMEKRGIKLYKLDGMRPFPGLLKEILAFSGL